MMYSKLYSYFDKNKILYGKQFKFRAHHSTDHPLFELVDSILNWFKCYFTNRKQYTESISCLQMTQIYSINIKT